MNTRRVLEIGAFLLAAAVTAPRIPAAVPDFDVRNTELADYKTHFKMPEYKSRKEWEARRQELQQQILSAAGLLPMPAKTPLRPKVVRRLEYKDYAIEVVLLETSARLLPRRKSVPAGRQEVARARRADSARPLETGAARGPAVVLRSGSRHQPGAAGLHRICLRHGGVQRYAPDLRIPLVGGRSCCGPSIRWACSSGTPFGRWTICNRSPAWTGAGSRPPAHPGEATQTFLLAAVDERIGFAAPVNMVSAYMQGGDPCEEAPNLRLDTFNVEIAAMIAPRPMLLVSSTHDWTRHTPVEEFPAIQRIYGLYGAPQNVQNAHIDAEHNYNRQSREAVYRFLARNLQTGHPAVEPVDEDISLPPDEDLLAFPEVGIARRGRLCRSVPGLEDRGIYCRFRVMSTRTRNATRYAMPCGAKWPSQGGELDPGQPHRPEPRRQGRSCNRLLGARARALPS